MPLLVQPHPKIITKNRHNRPNGWLVPIFNVHDGIIASEQHPQQVYATVVAPREIKGPHLHLKRWGLFTCISGNIRIVARQDGGYEEYYSGEDHDFATVQVPAGVPSALQNIGDKAAFVINMPAPAWHMDDQDEHPVSFEDYDFG
ncbi:MAG TPA: hypothetical protein VE863_20210 [Pyrinomonadaceae bacterium]|nr:hypothetical protein [Pyrinomonadaceae bacterium]